MKTRTREQGTREYYEADHRILAIRQILKRKSYAVVDGLMVDTTSANVYKTVYDALKVETRKKLEAMPIRKAFAIAFKLIA